MGELCLHPTPYCVADGHGTRKIWQAQAWDIVTFDSVLDENNFVLLGGSLGGPGLSFSLFVLEFMGGVGGGHCCWSRPPLQMLESHNC